MTGVAYAARRRGRGLTTAVPRCAGLAVAVLLAAATIVGCGGGDPASVPGVTGSFGTDPVITIPSGSPSADLVVQTLIPGNGPVVDPSDYVLFNVEGKVWAGDREVVDSFTDRQPQGLPLASAIPAWRHLAGQRVGSRVLMVVPPRYGFGRQGDPQANIMGTDTLVFVFDVVGVVGHGAHAEGTAVPYQPGPDRPAVSWRASGPVITVPSKAAPPKNLVSQLLIRGHGRPILNGQTIVAQYSGVVWSSGKVFDSSWQRGIPESFVLGSGQVLPGWEQGLGGVPVGSRVLLTIPPSLGYGQAGDPPDVSSNSTIVFVIDILAAV
jgi:peptidylprolyl isomerase